MIMLQKAVLPAREDTWVAGDDLLCGFVVRAADVTWAKTPRQLVEVHGLEFPGSPFSAASTAVDVLRFPATPMTRIVNATGARAGDQAVGGEGFVDHAPFTGNGFAAVGEQHMVPVWWLEPMRVPAGAELWRVHADGQEEFLSAYANVASGWQPGQPPRVPVSDVIGTFTHRRGSQVFADLLPNGRLVIASPVQQEGLKLTERGLWATTVDPNEVEPVFALRLTASWRGMPFQIVRRWQTENGIATRMVYLGRDSLAAEAAGLEKTDAAVYEATVLISELSDVQAVQLTTSREN